MKRSPLRAAAPAPRRATPVHTRAQIISEFETHLRASTNRKGRPYAEKTIHAYVAPARTLHQWLTRTGADPTEDFTACDVHTLNRFFADYYATHTPGGTTTLQRNLWPLFAWLEDEYDYPNPWRDRRFQRYSAPAGTRPQTLSADFIADLLRVTGGGSPRVRVFEKVRDHAIVRVLTEGLRAEELLSLRVGSLHLEQGLVGPLVPLKEARARGEGRVVPVQPKTAVALTRYLRARALHPRAEEPWLWLGARGRGRLKYHGLYAMLNRRAAEAGYGNPDRPDSRSIVHPHQARHTTAHDLLSSGVSESDVMQVMGWKDPSMLRRYAADMAASRAHAAVQRLGDRY